MTDNKKLYACLTYADSERAVALLSLLGFTESLIVRDPDDPAVVHHAQFTYSDGSGVMWASPDPSRVFRNAGTGNTYLSLATDDQVDELHGRLLAFGCESVQEPENADYGGRSAGVRDQEGNLWSFGSYQGA